MSDKILSEWRPDELERKERLEAGCAVLLNRKRDKRLVPWAKEAGLYVDISRSSKYGNPDEIGRDGTRDEVCDKYAAEVESKPWFKDVATELRGKALSCYCYPERCHGETLLKVINGAVPPSPTATDSKPDPDVSSLFFEFPPVQSTAGKATASTPTKATLLGPVPDIADALGGAVAHLRRYIVLQSPAPFHVMALWVAHAHAIEAFDYTPYLHVYSPEKRCGKSRLLDVLSHLVPRPWVFANPSEAVLFRKIEQDCPTILWDEIDAVFAGGVSDPAKDNLRGLLNCGFQRGRTIPRCVPPNHDVKEFGVFCPKILAGIGGLPDTMADRCIPVRLERKKKAQEAERFRGRDAAEIAKDIKVPFEVWAADAGVIAQLREARPAMPEELNDRQIDITEPLLAIADIAGGDWPEKARASILELFTGSKTESDSDGITLLRDIKKVFDDEGLNQISSETLLKKLIERAESPWAALWAKDIQYENIKGPAGKLAKLLKAFGIASRTLKFIGEPDAKGYLETTFLDAWERYL